MVPHLVKANTNVTVAEPQNKWLENVKMRTSVSKGSEPAIHFLTEMETLTRCLHEIIAANNVYLTIRGASPAADKEFAISNMLKKIHCPLLLVPADASLLMPEHIFYLTDLRFCRREVVNFIRKIAAPAESNITIAHVNEADLPNLDEKYSASLFNDAVVRHHKQCHLQFTYIKDRNFKRITDVLVNTMHAGLLATESKSSFFKVLASKNIDVVDLNDFSVPLLIFPS